jgi:hypothetical protein
VPGLPDAIFSYQKSQFGNILEGFGFKNVVIFYSRWVFLLSFGILNGQYIYFVVSWYTFERFGLLHQEKIWQPCRVQFSGDAILGAGADCFIMIQIGDNLLV